jgi:hypothetical protein
MAVLDISTEAGKRERSLVEHLQNLDRASNFLSDLSNHHYECKQEAVSMSLDVLNYLACIMDMAMDTISAELGLYRYPDRPQAKVFIRKPQAPEGQGGES